MQRSLARLGSVRPFQPFQVLLLNSILLQTGSKLYEIALPLILYDLTQSSVTMTSMRTAELLPNLFFAMFIGVLVDRVRKKTWALWMVGLQAALLFVLAGLLHHESTNALIWYYLIGFLLMTFNYGYFNVQVSLTKLSVAHSELTQANAKLSFVETLITILGPALTGVVLMVPNKSFAVLLTAACYSLCLLFFLAMPVQEQGLSAKPESFGRMLAEGLTAFCRNQSLWMLCVFVMLFNCTSSVVATAVLFYGKSSLHLSSTMLTLVLSLGAVGGLVGSALVNRCRSRFGLGCSFGLSALLSGLCYLGLFFSPNVVWLGVCLFGSELAFSVYVISAYTFRHEQTPDGLMGRIAGITGTVFRVGMPIAMLCSGYLTRMHGVTLVFGICAGWNILGFLVFARTRLWREA